MLTHRGVRGVFADDIATKVIGEQKMPNCCRLPLNWHKRQVFTVFIDFVLKARTVAGVLDVQDVADAARHHDQTESQSQHSRRDVRHDRHVQVQSASRGYAASLQEGYILFPNTHRAALSVQGCGPTMQYVQRNLICLLQLTLVYSVAVGYVYSSESCCAHTYKVFWTLPTEETRSSAARH